MGGEFTFCGNVRIGNDANVVGLVGRQNLVSVNMFFNLMQFSALMRQSVLYFVFNDRCLPSSKLYFTSISAKISTLNADDTN